MKKNVRLVSTPLMACFALLIAFSDSKAEKPISPETKDWGQVRFAIDQSVFGDLAEFRNAVMSKRILPEDFQKLSFVRPGEPGFNTNVDYEIFNEKSKRKVLTNGGDDVFAQRELDEMTTQKNQQPIFNLRRQLSPEGKKWDVLYFILPNAEQKYCDQISDKTMSLPKPIAPDNHTIVDDGDTKTLFACAKDPDGKLYVFGRLAERDAQGEAK